MSASISKVSRVSKNLYSTRTGQSRSMQEFGGNGSEHEMEYMPPVSFYARDRPDSVKRAVVVETRSYRHSLETHNLDSTYLGL